ncbi:V-type proton ATPase subunit F-like [Actinia tenebrosa]|uniref:V-type proton ATPase subunit F-like n=1 Tax=Actinia tenebrosa TaxID=6105 RepID=A0A6P8IA46_ACTTE|nr:V-type proton ATPase subunit F-like [Actinia tenebrosa]
MVLLLSDRKLTDCVLELWLGFLCDDVICFPCDSESNMAGVSAGAKGRLIAVIGDEDTCTGFLLGGIGEINAQRQKNFFVVNKETSVSEIEEKFQEFVNRKDIAILLINQNIAEEIRHVLDGYSRAIPAVLEIPSKEHPYDPSKDSILRRAKGLFSAEDFK